VNLVMSTQSWGCFFFPCLFICRDGVLAPLVSSSWNARKRSFSVCGAGCARSLLSRTREDASPEQRFFSAFSPNVVSFPPFLAVGGKFDFFFSPPLLVATWFCTVKYLYL